MMQYWRSSSGKHLTQTLLLEMLQHYITFLGACKIQCVDYLSFFFVKELISDELVNENSISVKKERESGRVVRRTWLGWH